MHFKCIACIFHWWFKGVWRVSDGCLKFLGKVSKSSEGWGGCTNFFALRAPDDDPPIFGRSIPSGPPQNAGTQCTSPPNWLRRRNFWEENFVNPPQKSKKSQIFYIIWPYLAILPQKFCTVLSIYFGTFHVYKRVGVFFIIFFFRLQQNWCCLGVSHIF